MVPTLSGQVAATAVRSGLHLLRTADHREEREDPARSPWDESQFPRGPSDPNESLYFGIIPDFQKTCKWTTHPRKNPQYVLFPRRHRLSPGRWLVFPDSCGDFGLWSVVGLWFDRIWAGGITAWSRRCQEQLHLHLVVPPKKVKSFTTILESNFTNNQKVWLDGRPFTAQL